VDVVDAGATDAGAAARRSCHSFSVKKIEAEVADGRVIAGAGGGADRGDAEVK